MAKGKAKGFELALARRTLALAVKGESVPLDVQEAAVRVDGGEGRASDIAKLRKFWGIRKTGAGALGKFRKGVARAQQLFSTASSDIDMLITAQSTGQPTGAIQARLINTLTTELQKFTKTKLVSELTIGVAESFGKSPQSARVLLNSLRGALRFGGAVASVALAGVEVAERYYANRLKSAASQGRVSSMVRDYQGDRSLARREANTVSRIVTSQLNAYEKVKNYLGFDAETQEEIEKQTAARLQFRQNARNFAGRFGIDTQAELAKGARRRGKTSGMLSDRERGEILDEAIDRSMAINTDRLTRDDQVRRQLDREFRTGEGGSGAWAYGARYGRFQTDQLRSFGSWATFGYIRSQEEVERLRLEVLARERGEQLLKTLKALQEDGREMAKQMRERRTPAEQLKHDVTMQQRDADWTAYRSRRQAWANQ